MANNGYYKNNRNGGYNHNYNRNRNFNNFNAQYRTNNNAAFEGFDASVYKMPDFSIKDLNGNIYTIKGNIDTELRKHYIEDAERISKIQESKQGDISIYPELIDLFRDWCLTILNLNVDGEKYTMDDVNAGFNDMYVLQGLFDYTVAKIKMIDDTRKTPVKANS